MYIATIDGGTSNTRVIIWREGRIAGKAKAAVGVRDTAIDGSNKRLAAAVRDLLGKAAGQAGIQVAAISLILAAGMVTSDMGLLEVPHAAAPVSLDELAGKMTAARIADIADQPIWFIPGVKNMADAAVTPDNAGNMDMMRGEETEAAGLLEYVKPAGNAVLVLPGSHNKYAMVSAGQRIQGCMTTLAGEVLRSLTFDTILASTLRQSFARSFDEAAFCRGVADRKEQGFLHAAFKTRIVEMFCHYTAEQARNYLLGVILADDFLSLQKSSLFQKTDPAVYIVAGNPVMQEAYGSLLSASGRHVVMATEQQKEGLSGYGAISLARRRGLL